MAHGNSMPALRVKMHTRRQSLSPIHAYSSRTTQTQDSMLSYSYNHIMSPSMMMQPASLYPVMFVEESRAAEQLSSITEEDDNEDKEGNEDEDNGEDEDDFAQGQQITPATSYDESLEHQFREAPNGKNLGPVWDNSGGRFMPYKKDYVTGRVRRRSMIDDMLDMMSREKLAKYITQKRWANNDDDSDKDDEEDKEEEDKVKEDNDDEDENASRFDILMT